MIRLNNLSVIESFNDVVPHAASFGETYLRSVVRGIQECDPPVALAIDTVDAARAVGTPKMQCLVVEPTSKRLRHYKTLHYGTPLGTSLKVGWFLIGGEYAEGRQVGFFTVGAATDLDVNEVLSIVQLIQQCAVQPAMQEIADGINYGNAGRTGGFFGV